MADRAAALAASHAASLARDWRILIVDDDEDVHRVTRLVLSRFRFQGRGIVFVSAYSAAEARSVISSHGPFAIVLLDVVMEEPNSGLLLVRHIREEAGDILTRIILRTGQPGQAPENRVIVDYDINDYKSKTELTEQKLITSVVAALRSYADMVNLERSRLGLEMIVKDAAAIFEPRSPRALAVGVLERAAELLRPAEAGGAAGISGVAAAAAADGSFSVIEGIGRYAGKAGEPLAGAVPARALAAVETAATAHGTALLPGGFVSCLQSGDGSRTVIYLDGCVDLDEGERALIEVFCSSAAAAFDNARLNAEIEESQREIVFTLGDIVDQRSKETGNHVRRVAEYSRLLGIKAGLSDREAEILRIASSMHDIGKLGIPDHILDKEGVLDQAEYDIMRTHAEIGSIMLRRSNRELLRAASAIALQHHERWDGSGYPAGRKGEEIHLFARIVAIADVFDAISHDRVYRKAMSRADVLSFFSGEGRSFFDPRVLALFIENIDEFYAIQDVVEANR